MSGMKLCLLAAMPDNFYDMKPTVEGVRQNE